MDDAFASPTQIGRYRVVERIGEGGMGVVHLAVSADGTLVAVKSLRPWVVGGADGRARFQREVAAMQKVRGPRIAEVIDADVNADPPYVVTRYIRGTPLSKLIKDHGPLRNAALERLATGLLEALASVHAAGIVHRDVKPGNVLVTDDGPVLIDFGLAHGAEETRLTAVGSVVGTPGYLAPESALGQSASAATDVHGWASTIVFAATGRPPYGSGPDAVVLDRIRRGDHDASGVPEPLTGVVSRALSADPSGRPSVSDIGHALGIADTLPASAVPNDASPGDATAVTQVVGPETAVTEVVAPNSGQGPADEAATAVLGRSEPATTITGPPPPPPAAPLQHTEGAPLRPWQPRLAVGLAGIALVVLLALLPYAGAVVLLVALLIGRTTWRVRRRLFDRRAGRGARKNDPLVATLSAPVDIASAAIPSLVQGILVCSAGFGVGAALNLVGGFEGGLVPYLVGALVTVVLAWWGPGASKFRYGVRVIAGPLERAGRPAWIVVGVLVALAWTFALLLDNGGPSWWPFDGAPNPFD